MGSIPAWVAKVTFFKALKHASMGKKEFPNLYLLSDEEMLINYYYLCNLCLFIQEDQGTVCDMMNI